MCECVYVCVCECMYIGIFFPEGGNDEWGSHIHIYVYYLTKINGKIQGKSKSGDPPLYIKP